MFDKYIHDRDEKRKLWRRNLRYGILFSYLYLGLTAASWVLSVYILFYGIFFQIERTTDLILAPIEMVFVMELDSWIFKWFLSNHFEHTNPSMNEEFALQTKAIDFWEMKVNKKQFKYGFYSSMIFIFCNLFCFVITWNLTFDAVYSDLWLEFWLWYLYFEILFITIVFAIITMNKYNSWMFELLITLVAIYSPVILLQMILQFNEYKLNEPFCVQVAYYVELFTICALGISCLEILFVFFKWCVIYCSERHRQWSLRIHLNRVMNNIYLNAGKNVFFSLSQIFVIFAAVVWNNKCLPIENYFWVIPASIFISTFVILWKFFAFKDLCKDTIS